MRASPGGVKHMDVLNTKTPGAFLRTSPGGVKHMDVLNTKKGRIDPPLTRELTEYQAGWTSARKNQVSNTESGLSDTLSMPCSISHFARSG